MTLALERPSPVAPLPPAKGRAVHLDAVRGLAAITVLASHYVAAYGLPFAPNLLTYSPLHLFFDGYAAVSMFFVLSGLVLSMKHFVGGGRPTLDGLNLAGYAILRFCRIWLPFAAAVLLGLAAKSFLRAPTGSPWLRAFWSGPTTYRSLARELMLFRSGTPQQLFGVFQLLPQGWTLAVELVLSMLVPLGILLAARSAGWLLGLTAFAIASLGLTPFAFHFALGICLAKHGRQWSEAVNRRRLMVPLLAVGLLLYTFRYTLPVYLGGGVGAVYSWYATGLGSAMLLLFVTGSEGARRLLSAKPFAYLGEISYSVYLVHLLVLLCLTPRIVERLPAGPGWPLGFLTTVVFTLLLAHLSYVLIERPSIAIGRALSGRIARHLTRRD